MPLDDRARVQRLREAPRTDLPLGERMHRFCAALQTRVCRELEHFDPAARCAGDGGRRVIEAGDVFAEGVVEVFVRPGELSEAEARASRAAPGSLVATGLSVALHARNPYVPSGHVRLRYVRLGEDPFRPSDAWFDGGALVVPSFPFREDDAHVRRAWEAVCGRHPEVATVRLVEGRSGTQAVGLVFGPLRGDPEGAFHFVREVGRAFLPSYVPLVARRRATPYGAEDLARRQRQRENLAGADALAVLGAGGE